MRRGADAANKCERAIVSVSSSIPRGGGELTRLPVVFSGSAVGLEFKLRPGEGGQRRALFGGIVKGGLALRIVVISRLEAGDGRESNAKYARATPLCGGCFRPPLRDIGGARHIHRISLHLKFSIKPGVCGRRRFHLSRFLASDHDRRYFTHVEETTKPLRTVFPPSLRRGWIPSELLECDGCMPDGYDRRRHSRRGLDLRRYTRG